MAKDYSRLAKQLEDRAWMLYGAYGYTGKLIIEECIRLGLRPTLAGRSIAPLRSLAAEYKLPWRMLELDNPTTLRKGLEDMALVYHVAGPYVKTAAPMIDACIDTRTHYIDVTGELPAVRYAIEQHEKAKAADVVLLPSNGVNCVPTDCLVQYLVEQFRAEGSVDLKKVDVGIDTVRSRSAGSLNSILQMAGISGEVRRDGDIKKEPVGVRSKKVKFTHGTQSLISLPLTDIDLLYWQHQIPDITAYIAQNPLQSKILQLAVPVGKQLFNNDGLRSSAQKLIKERVRGPGQKTRRKHRTYAWAKLTDSRGRVKQAWLETIEGYALTAAIAPRAVCEVLSKRRSGVYSPAQLLGADFLLDLPNTVRFSSLKEDSDSESLQEPIVVERDDV